jgi:hypothetical protein
VIEAQTAAQSDIRNKRKILLELTNYQPARGPAEDASDVLRYAFTLTEMTINHQYEVHPFSKYFFDTIVALCFGLNLFGF